MSESYIEARVPLSYIKKVFLDERKTWVERVHRDARAMPYTIHPAGLVAMHGLELLEKELNEAITPEDLDLVMRKWGRINLREWVESL